MSTFYQSSRRSSRTGLTLVEMLVGLTITLIMMFAIVQIFQVMGTGIQKSRAMIEISSQLRGAGQRLQDDLDRVTVPVRPVTPIEAGMGILQYYEGTANDFHDAGKNVWQTPDGSGNNVPNTMQGDIDDVITFTARAKDKPFTGQYQGTQYESPLAEIVWWCQWDATNQSYTLRRRVFLILPELNNGGTINNLDWQNHDISVDASNRPNSLASLGDPDNRTWNQARARGVSLAFSTDPSALSERAGEDIILTDVLSFDVKAYAPDAPLQIDSTSTTALVPGDPGYSTTSTGSGVPRGAFVDLGDGTTPSVFSSHGPIYDTGYLLPNDPAFNGLDDGGISGVVDDPGERTSIINYPYPLRGLLITVRTYDHQTRQVRQQSIVADFLPE